MSWFNGAISRLIEPRIRERVQAEFEELQRKGFFPGPGGAGYNAVNLWTDAVYDDIDANESAYEVNAFVHRCVTIIAESCADIPWKLYEWVQDEGELKRQEVTDHPLLDLLERPAVRSSGNEFKRELFSHVPLSGEAFVYADNGTNGARLSPPPTKLQPLKPRFIANVEVLENGEVGRYVYRQTGDEVKIDPEFIVHIKTFNPRNPTRGLSIVEVAQSPVLLDWYMNRHNQNFFKNGANPGTVFSTKENINPESRQAIIDSWKKQHQGVENAHKTAFLTGGFEPKPIAMSAKDGEFIGMANMSRDRIMVLFGVVPAVLGVSQDLNYATSRDQTRIFYTHTVMPHVSRMTDAFNNQFIPVWYRSEWQSRGLHLLGDFSGVQALQEDQEQQQRTLVGYVGGGIMAVNEARERINLEPIEGDEFDMPKTPGASPFAGLLGGRRPVYIKGTRKPSRLDQWKARDRDFITSERIVERAMMEFFDDQLDRLLKRLNDVPEIVAVGATPGNGTRNRIIRFDAPEVMKFSLDDLAFIWQADKENEEILAVMRPILRDIIEQAGNGALAEVGAAALFKLEDPRVTAFLAQKELTLAGINGTTLELLQNLIASGAGEGASVGEIGRMIRDAYGDMSRWRAETIARTEAVAGNNFAAVEGYRQSGVVQRKEWLVAPGAANPRHELVPGLDGQQVELDAPFIVNGYEMPMPGVGGPPEEVINCRCTVLPVVED